MPLLRRLPALLSLVLALIGCAGDGPSASPTRTPRSPSPSASPSIPDVPAIDWNALPREAVEAGEWTFVACEGDAPLLCVRRDGRLLGSVEAATYSASGNLSGRQALEREARRYLASMEQDRADGCPQGYAFEAEDPEPATVAGGEGLRVDWRVRTGAGRLVERNIVYLRGSAETVSSLTATSLAPEGACLERMGSELTPEDLETFAPVLEALAAKATLPVAGA